MRKYIIYTVVISIIASLVLLNVCFAKSCPQCPPVPQGPQGEQGEKGNTGAQGDKGESGDNTLKTPYGAGLDVIVWESKSKNVAVETEYKYDVNNQDHSIYGIVKVNLWEMLTKKE